MREKHKYDLYQDFDAIVYAREEPEFVIESISGGADAGGVVEIEWNEVEEAKEGDQWEIINKESQPT